MSGKGDKQRPVNKNKYDKNYDSINWVKKEDKEDKEDNKYTKYTKPKKKR